MIRIRAPGAGWGCAVMGAAVMMCRALLCRLWRRENPRLMVVQGMPLGSTE